MITEDSKNILVADDSVFFRTKLSDILVEAGHKVRFAKDGREVINELRIDCDALDLLILDLQMPDIDGFGVLEWIKDSDCKGKFPILAVTGVYEPSDVLGRLRDLGANGLMSKGFTPEEIIFRVNRILFPDKVPGNRAPTERVPVSLAVDFTVGDLTRTGFLLNISETGSFLHTKVELLTGTSVHMRFSLPGSQKILDVKGIVKWTTAEVASRTLFGGSGIMFSTISAEDQAQISEFVASETKRLGLDRD
jgi:two-component system chemotaxis response regulator CheY